MNAATLKALKRSIRNWKAVEKGAVKRGSADCPLCALFRWDCAGCPVAEKTARAACRGTPYEDWEKLATYIEEEAGFVAESTRAKLAAHDMLEFLRSLLPKPQQGRT